MKDSRKIIKMPLVSEKSTNLRADQNKYVFRVDKKANKMDIKKAVEELFKVKVEDVTTMMMYGKPKRLGRFEGRRPDWKKAIVKLKKGETIELFEAV
ncbi:MAG: 50S ribosomal protein L23 [candidate division Zixibacteria bacterium SM23_73_3]|nr:MAG: 50S ribosomal protein L23 [candidate division Zixibacteria bacterium SM23_73_3]